MYILWSCLSKTKDIGVCVCVCVYEREREMVCQENISRRILQETVS